MLAAEGLSLGLAAAARETSGREGSRSPAPALSPSDREDVLSSSEAEMRVQFVQRDNGPQRLVCEAEIVFDEAGPLLGMKLVGFSLWKSPEGEVSVTFPARAFGAGSERRFFDYLRSAQGDAAEVRRVKAWIVEEFRASSQAA